MNYETLANLVMIFHSILILVVILGILIAARYKKYRPIEVIVLLLAIIIWSLYNGCPLTYLENFLRIKAGNPLPLNELGFIPFYINKWFSFPVSSHQLEISTYITSGVFLLTSIEWMNPVINPKIIELRKIFIKTR